MGTKLTKFSQKIFGSQSGLNQHAKFGSLAAGTPEFIAPNNDGSNANLVQSLGNYLVGWYGATINGASPAKQDMNSLFYLVTRQLSYLFQAGLAEWDTDTEYFIGSYVNVAGVQYVSKIDNNQGNDPAANPDKWKRYSNLPTGLLVPTAALTADAGFVLASGRTIGNAASNATERANADCYELFALIWAGYTDAEYPIKTSAGAASTRGGTALADWNANKQITIFDVKDRGIIGRGNMGGTAANRITSFDTTKLASAGGLETANHTHGLANHSHGGYTGGGDGNAQALDAGGGNNGVYSRQAHTHGVQTYGPSTNTSDATAPSTVQPSFVANVLIKL